MKSVYKPNERSWFSSLKYGYFITGSFRRVDDSGILMCTCVVAQERCTNFPSSRVSYEFISNLLLIVSRDTTTNKQKPTHIHTVLNLLRSLFDTLRSALPGFDFQSNYNSPTTLLR